MNALNNANIQDDHCPGPASFAFPAAKSSRTGESVRYVPTKDKQWYVLRIKYGKAQDVSDAIVESGGYVYLAKVWKDIRDKETGKKHRRLVPFLNLLFAYATEEEAEKYVRDSKESKYTTFYYDHFEIGHDGKNPPLTVDGEDMMSFVRVTAVQDEHVMEVNLNECRFLSDDLVRVNFGPFEGVKGRVARIARQNRVVVYLKGLGSGITTAYIPPYYLEKIQS